MNIILLGYNRAACQILEILAEEDHQLFVFTHEAPEHIPSLIDISKKLHIPYITSKVNECEEIVRKFNPDIIVSIYYRYIVNKEILDVPLKGCFNLHPSLLPQYRGCSSLTWALINGETHAGVTYHYMEESVDSGNIILQASFNIENNDTQGSIYLRIIGEVALMEE
jgi:UDP-4-amino-4-deoxy-L-arabinose formyltransferase/UDP-glucuronic acid dehydrogenase (UDP-4-keto-hexauronic acid decarboxylating)